MDRKFLTAFSEVIREEVSRKNEVKLEGVGSFNLEHQKQVQKQYRNGRVVMMPPEDRIIFVPKN